MSKSPASASLPGVQFVHRRDTVTLYYRNSITILDGMDALGSCGYMEHQDLLNGLIRLHVLHHAVEGEVYGQFMIEELANHGYKLSAGTLYPMLRSMEKKGYLISEKQRAGRSVRHIYRATPLGREALEMARGKVRELIGEMLEHR
jgi:PadR family transcriptional regulator, regulatory protein PadR